MTINKSQGQTFKSVGVFLPRPVFSHGQLYVAISRCGNPEGLRILVQGTGSALRNTTTNVVFSEIFHYFSTMVNQTHSSVVEYCQWRQSLPHNHSHTTVDSNDLNDNDSVCNLNSVGGPPMMTQTHLRSDTSYDHGRNYLDFDRPMAVEHRTHRVNSQMGTLTASDHGDSVGQEIVTTNYDLSSVFQTNTQSRANTQPRSQTTTLTDLRNMAWRNTVSTNTTFSWLYVPIILEALKIPSNSHFPRPIGWNYMVSHYQQVFQSGGIHPQNVLLTSESRYVQANIQEQLMDMSPDMRTIVDAYGQSARHAITNNLQVPSNLNFDLLDVDF